MTTLEKRRDIALTTFIFDIIKDNIDVPGLKDKVIFNRPLYNLRQPKLLKEHRSTTNFEHYDTINLGIRLFNAYSDCFDFNINMLKLCNLFLLLNIRLIFLKIWLYKKYET
jgi:hypothetical protein